MIHVLGLAHTEATRAFEFCAFTARTRVFASMMARAGHDVTLYGAGEAETDAEFVSVASAEDQRRWWPDYDGSRVFNDFDPGSVGWREFNARCVEAIQERASARDLLAITMGRTQRAVAQTGLMSVEVGVGYSGVWAPYRVFESHAWRSFLAAREPTDAVNLYHAVIPRAWEAPEFPAGDGSGGYFAFVGRVIAAKGPRIAAEVCQRIGAKLLVAGQGVREARPGRVVAEDGTVLEGDVEYVGVVGPDERARLMGGAIATFAPTTYFEPLGGVAIESMLVGTPAITTDYGAFTETVAHGTTGYRCATLADFARAATLASALDRRAIREAALARWSTEAVVPQFTAYFDRLATLWEAGWYA